jgi:hypothetical protein
MKEDLIDMERVNKYCCCCHHTTSFVISESRYTCSKCGTIVDVVHHSPQEKRDIIGSAWGGFRTTFVYDTGSNK